MVLVYLKCHSTLQNKEKLWYPIPSIRRRIFAKINLKWIYLKKRCKARSRGRQWQPLEFGCPENLKIKFTLLSPKIFILKICQCGSVTFRYRSGSAPLTYGSGLGSGSYYYHQWLTR